MWCLDVKKQDLAIVMDQNIVLLVAKTSHNLHTTKGRKPVILNDPAVRNHALIFY